MELTNCIEISNCILVNLVTISVAALGIVIAIIIYKFDQRNKKNKETINQLANQIEAYWCLENIYCNDIIINKGGNYQPTLCKFRDEAVLHPDNISKTRPNFTSNQVQKYKK